MVEPQHSDNTPPVQACAAHAARASRKKIGLLIVAALIAVALIVWWHPWNRTTEPTTSHDIHGRHGGSPGNQAQPVRVATAQLGDMPIVLTELGTVTPLANVTVRTQLAGTLQAVAFQEGQMVKQGDLLAQIDPRPYQIALENAQGALAKDTALLQTARVDLKRYRILLTQDSIASQQVDTQASLVKQYEGQVQSDRADIDTQKLNLIYARITAPVAGRVGLRQVDAGNYVTPGDANGIVVITQLQPISVIFTIPEDSVPTVLKQLHAGATLSASAYDRTNTTLLETGYLDTLDNQIDTTTGTLKLRAMFANTHQMLFPNQFVNARLLVDTIHHAVIVPSSAVLNGASGQFVYRVKPDHTVTVQPVKIGPIDGERTSIASGLQAGETVVIDGSDRLREGTQITIPSNKSDKPTLAASETHAALHPRGATP